VYILDQHDIASLLSHLITLDTQNPPGNETLAASYVQSVLRQHGVCAEVYESAPGRGSVVARIKGDGSSRPLLLLSHLDVVDAPAEGWTEPPLSGNIRDGIVWGRGALDCKNLTAIHTAIMVHLAKNNLNLKRDVIMAATADEESGGKMGIGWLARHHPEQIAAEYCLNEGGGFGVTIGNHIFYTCNTAEKGTVRLRLVASGRSGHAAMAPRSSAVALLAKAVSRLCETRLPLHPTETSREFLTAIARGFAMPAQAVRGMLSNEALLERTLAMILKDEYQIDSIHAMLRNTAAPTIIRAGYRINVVPGEAVAELDGRVLPGLEPEVLIQEVENLVKDLVRVERISVSHGSESPQHTHLYRLIQEVTTKRVPNARLVPFLLTGSSDARHTRAMGTVTYGFCPVLPGEPINTCHGVDERVSIKSLDFGFKMLREIVERLCT